MSEINAIAKQHNFLNDQCILHAYRGSIAHGMYVPKSQPNSIDDKDTMAVCIPSIDHYFGLKNFGSRGTIELVKGEWDIVAYEFLKFMELLEKGNPNVLSMLWCNEQHIIKISESGKLLRANKELFVGKHVYHSFSGYAYSQLKRMTHLACEGYMGEKRKQLVQKFGYDTKNAAHLIRLLRMCIEFLVDGELRVHREDAPNLLSIKNGDWSLEQVKTEADKLFDLSKEAFVRSPLPVKPDHEKINDLAVKIMETHFYDRTK